MTKEERAIKWFSKVDQNQEIDLKTKMKICDMAAMIMLLIIFLVLAIELSLLVGLGGIDVINAATDFINSKTYKDGQNTSNYSWRANLSTSIYITYWTCNHF